MAIVYNCAAGSTVAFGTSDWVGYLRTFAFNDMSSRSAVDTSHLGLTAYDPNSVTSAISAHKTYVPGRLMEPGTITLGIIVPFAVAADGGMDSHPATSPGGAEPPIAEPNETITLTFADTGATTDAKVAYTGHVTGWNHTGDAENAWAGELTIQFSGNPSWTDPT